MLQTRNYNSFDDYVEKELYQFKKFLASGGLAKLNQGTNRYYESIIRGKWKFFLKGIYSYHLERWLRMFSRTDILVLDGDLLTSRPWTIMRHVQTFLNLSIHITAKNFVINPDTGFYCLTEKEERLCLGRNKGNTRTRLSSGHIISNIPKKSRKSLQVFYKSFENKLLKLTGQTFSWMFL